MGKEHQAVIGNVYIMYSFEPFDYGTKLSMECMTHKQVLKVADLISSPRDGALVEYLKLFADKVTHARQTTTKEVESFEESK